MFSLTKKLWILAGNTKCGAMCQWNCRQQATSAKLNFNIVPRNLLMNFMKKKHWDFCFTFTVFNLHAKHFWISLFLFLGLKTENRIHGQVTCHHWYCIRRLKIKPFTHDQHQWTMLAITHVYCVTTHIKVNTTSNWTCKVIFEFFAFGQF